MARERMVTMAQSVNVMGLGCHTFEDATSTLKEICLIAEREFKNGMLDKWSRARTVVFPP